MKLIKERGQQAAQKKSAKQEAVAAAQEGTEGGGDKAKQPPSIEAVISQAIANIDVSGEKSAGRGEKGPTIRASYEIAAQAKSGSSTVLSGASLPTVTKQVGSVGTAESAFLSTGLGASKEDGDGEVVECSLVDDPKINQQLSDELNNKRNSRKYKDILCKREQLPAFKLRDPIVAGIARHRVAVISGDTG